jgi:hypothetical protein
MGARAIAAALPLAVLLCWLLWQQQAIGPMPATGAALEAQGLRQMPDTFPGP